MIEYDLIKDERRQLKRGLLLFLGLAAIGSFLLLTGSKLLWNETAVVVAVDNDTFGAEPVCVGGDCLQQASTGSSRPALP